MFLINIEINEYLEFLSCKKSLLTGNDKRTRLMYEGIQVGNFFIVTIIMYENKS